MISKLIKILTQDKRKKQEGFTLIEILVVVVIIGLLASLVGPKLFKKVDKAKIEVAKEQIRELKVALDLYKLDVGKYPDSLEALIHNDGSENWDGPYLQKKYIPNDPWGNPYQYEVIDGGDSVRITSTGGGKITITNED